MANMTTLQILQGVHDWVLGKIDEETANFITKTVNDLVNYYTKSETYTKAEVQQIVDAIKQFTYEVVQVLPTASVSTMNKIYLVPAPKSEDKNVKEEYITISTTAYGVTTYSWEMLGTTSIDLSNYYTKTETDAAITQLLNYVSHSYTNTTDLNTLLAQKQDTLVSGTNIKTINNTSILGSGNISIQGGSDNIYKAAVTVSALTSSPLPSGTVDALIAMRSELQGHDLVLLPYSDNPDVTCTPAVVIENGSTFQMVFYDGNALYTVYGDPNDSYTVTKTEFYTANDLEPTANAEALNNIMLMFDLPKYQSDFYNTDNNKHYFYVLPPASENITMDSEFVTWLVGGSTKHLSVTYSSDGADEPATFVYVSGYNFFAVEISPDMMFNVICTKAENGYYKCEIIMNDSGGPEWTSITLV